MNGVLFTLQRVSVACSVQPPSTKPPDAPTTLLLDTPHFGLGSARWPTGALGDSWSRGGTSLTAGLRWWQTVWGRFTYRGRAWTSRTALAVFLVSSSRHHHALRPTTGLRHAAPLRTHREPAPLHAVLYHPPYTFLLHHLLIYPTYEHPFTPLTGHHTGSHFLHLHLSGITTFLY